MKNSSSATTNTTTLKVPKGEDSITFGDVTWDSHTHKASVTVSKENSAYKLRYWINSDGEHILVDGDTQNVTNLSDNSTLYAELWDGTNAGESKSLLIKDLDPPTVKVNVGTITTSSITVTVEATDDKSGMPDTPKYTYYIKKRGKQ